MNEEKKDLFEQGLNDQKVESQEEKIENNSERIVIETNEKSNLIEENQNIVSEFQVEESVINSKTDNIENREILPSTFIDQNQIEKNYNQLSNTKEKQNKKTKIFIILGIITLIIITIISLYSIFNNSKNLFLRAINKEYVELTDSLNLNEYLYKDFKNSSMIQTGNLKLTVTDIDEELIGKEAKTLLEEVNKLDFKYKYGLYYKNKRLSLLTNIQYDKKDMIKINMYGKEKNLYLELKDLFSKYIYIPYEELDSLFEDPNVTIEDLKKLTKSIKNALLSSLDKKDFKETKETIKIDNKEEKVRKIYYTLNNKNLEKTIISVLEKLMVDKEFLSIISKYSENSESEVKDEINSIIEDFILESEDIELVFSIYFKGINNEAIKYVLDINELQSNIKLSYQKGNKQKEFTIFKNQEEIITLLNEKENDNNSKIIITIPSLDLEGIIKINNDSNINTFDFVFQNIEDEFKITGKFVQNIERNDKNIKGNSNIDIKIDTKNKTIANIKVTEDLNGTVKEEIDFIENALNSVNIDDINEEEVNEILTNIMENETLVNFINKISSIIYGSELY